MIGIESLDAKASVSTEFNDLKDELGLFIF